VFCSFSRTVRRLVCFFKVRDNVRGGNRHLATAQSPQRPSKHQNVATKWFPWAAARPPVTADNLVLYPRGRESTCCEVLWRPKRLKLSRGGPSAERRTIACFVGRTLNIYNNVKNWMLRNVSAALELCGCRALRIPPSSCSDIDSAVSATLIRGRLQSTSFFVAC